MHLTMESRHCHPHRAISSSSLHTTSTTTTTTTITVSHVWHVTRRLSAMYPSGNSCCIV